MNAGKGNIMRVRNSGARRAGSRVMITPAEAVPGGACADTIPGYAFCRLVSPATLRDVHFSITGADHVERYIQEAIRMLGAGPTALALDKAVS